MKFLFLKLDIMPGMNLEKIIQWYLVQLDLKQIHIDVIFYSVIPELQNLY